MHINYASPCCLALPRLTYPTLRQNASAFALLPNFIEVAGRKMDATDVVLAGALYEIISQYANCLPDCHCIALHDSFKDKLQANANPRAAPCPDCIYLAVLSG